MSPAYKFYNTHGLYFVIFTAVGWIDLFSQVAATQPALQTCESGGYDTNGQYLMVAYYQMIPILVTAIKEQQSIIKNQDTLIINQEKRLDEIEKKLNIIISNE